MTHPFDRVTAARQRGDLLVRISHVRWAAAALGLVMVPLAQPRPIFPEVLTAMGLLLAAANVVPAVLPRRTSRHLDLVAAGTLTVDMLVCTAWVMLTANDPAASNYVVYTVIAVEAAVLFRWRGTLGFIAAFLTLFGLMYLERALVFQSVDGVGSMIFRSAIVVVMALLAGTLSSATETRQAAAEAAAHEAFVESERLRTVHQVARDIASSLRRDEVLNSAISALRALFRERWAGILLDDGDGVMRLASSTGQPDAIAVPLPDASLYSIRDTVLIDDIWSSPYLDRMGVLPPDSVRGYQSAAIVPLFSGDRLLGALAVLDAVRSKFDPSDVKLLETIGPQISTALENARLYEEVEGLSLADSLTRLGNRRAFDQRLEHEVERAQRYGAPLSLALIDIDHFKLYNDTHGHQAGDEILRRLGKALVETMLRRTDLPYRYGGEEFAVLMPETSARDAEAVMRRVHEALALEPLPHADHQPGGHLTISVGIACSEGGDSPGRGLVEQADLALFGAKQSGRNRTLVHDSRLAATLTNWTRLLPAILDDHTVHAVYQPIVRLRDGGVLAFEALARPTSRDALLSVEGMFAAAHRMGSLQDLDWLCFRAAIQDASSLPAGSSLFVNITLASLLDASRDPEYLELVLRWARRPTADVVLEISEREAVSDLPRLVEILASYRELGFRFALDDVGEGHSTLELLAAAEPEYVKIARSLVRGIGRSGSAGTVRALVEFARATGSRVVAEGIDHDDIVDRMLELGVELGQGYTLGRPRRLEQQLPGRGAGNTRGVVDLA